ncbi:DUF4097 domain-containing protein [Clostridium kluyveri]|uniref:DUF4097 domain-containing protein n=1 Tax=Clostridium kluyveri TaxID=1534 RepID=A0A1L5FB09_CLOKL|nr:DUF4097 domain-containing protein [Clostridium kluyveri]APM40000.1 hypothetical protein BS101_15280 [Clostridium kluyveri]UZQ49762.1 DUF4097 domain-containing protein [Clostridium kluyveri]
MNRRLIKGLIVIWIAIAVAGAYFLIYGILHGNSFSNFQFLDKSKGKIYNMQKDEDISIKNCNKISLDFSNEDIFIQTTDEANLRVVQSSVGKLKNEDKFVMSKNGDNIEIKTNNRNGRFKFHVFQFININQKIEVYIPKKYVEDLYVNLSSGDMSFNSSVEMNDIYCSQASGDLYVKGGITGNNVNIKTTSGDINADGIYSKYYKLENTSGDIRINSISGSGDIKAVSGDVKVNYRGIDNYSKINSVSGDIDLVIPKSLSFKFNGQSISGDINSDFPLNYENTRKNRAAVQVGNPPYKTVDVNAVSGDINLSQ